MCVLEKPSFVSQPETSRYEAGSKVELECQASGFPKPLIEWKKDNSAENLPPKVQIRENTLVIPEVQAEDEGEYTCVASNQLASIEAKAYLVVYERPTFTKTMSNLTIGIESKSVTLECNARGKPAPVIFWAKSGHVGEESRNGGNVAGQEDFIILENGNLFIERLSKRFEGTYLCQASNEHGSAEARTLLQVKPVQSKPPPIVVYGPQNQTVPFNVKLELYCLSTTASSAYSAESLEAQAQVGGGDKIIVTWYKDEKAVNLAAPNGKYRLLDTGTLEVKSTESSDAGIYKCVASNAYGATSSLPAQVHVEHSNNLYVAFQSNVDPTVLPSAPTQPVAVQSSAQSVTLTWQPSAHSGHSPVRAYALEYFSPEWPKTLPGWLLLDINIPPIGSFTVDNLQPDTYYIFMVRARNDFGFGPPSPVSDLVKTLCKLRNNFILSVF